MQLEVGGELRADRVSENLLRSGVAPTLTALLMRRPSLAGNVVRGGVVALLLAVALRAASADPSAFLGRWALTIPGGAAGWLEVKKENGWFDGSILWGGGSVVPV